MNKKNIKQAGILVFLLLFPSLLYVLFSHGKHKILSLPYYGPKEPVQREIDGDLVIDTLYYTVPEWGPFFNQFGESVSSADLNGKIVVANFFFTSCPSICPTMSEQLQILQHEYKEDDEVKIVSFSVDPINDSIPRLFKYSKIYGAIKDKWHFLTGERDSIYKFARNGVYLTALDEESGEDGFIHSEKIVLIDQKGHIRGYFDGTDYEEMKKLQDAVKVLLAEKYVPKKDNDANKS